MTHQCYNGKWESDGSDLQRQMENAQEPGCKIPRCTFTLDDMDDRVWIINYTDECLPWEFYEWIEGLSLPQDTQDDTISPYKYVCLVKRELPPMSWVGRVGEGVIFLDVIARSEGNEYYISDLTKMAYESFFALDTLKYVFVNNIVNAYTTDLLSDIYCAKGIDYRSPDEYTWESSSAEFKALIGCGIGKCVASFILAAYGQGVKRIARITTWRTGHELEMLFYIENVA
ncbi:uncharacterized protein N7503_003276 [Penicillium pulvis]|uniref:uncharacterized protein n=1 Tax=Penicillium pulvis TaxID=1562058 RepID=UPI0025465A83|nr:uncharacterized protein N7503_003276 [Penicillium pulvis]KAJ5805674.1 hypothetical protein N7503_003276 [Penicillium pulvis]